MDWEIRNHNFIIICRKILFFFFFFSVFIISLYALFSTINTKTVSLAVAISAETKSDCYHLQKQLHVDDDDVEAAEAKILMVQDNEEKFEHDSDEMIIATESIVIRRSLLIASFAKKRLSDGSNGVRSKGFMMSLPGSSPPRCTSKCGKCRPCKPVHVAVPPGTPVTTEYYPEAWRCKCGNKLYMP